MNVGATAILGNRPESALVPQEGDFAQGSYESPYKNMTWRRLGHLGFMSGMCKFTGTIGFRLLSSGGKGLAFGSISIGSVVRRSMGNPEISAQDFQRCCSPVRVCEFQAGPVGPNQEVVACKLSE